MEQQIEQQNNLEYWFTNSFKTSIYDIYQFDINTPIGTGGYSKVYKGTLKTTKEIFAIKVIPKNELKNKIQFQEEVEIMLMLNHPRIIKLYEIYENAEYIYLILEYLEGGELYEKIIENTKLSEDQAKIYFKQIIQALDYCHRMKVSHRDLKPENFLLINKDKDSKLKLIDFGLASTFESSDDYEYGSTSKMNKRAGTLFYVSPEVIEGEYDESCDIWSAGVLLYILLSGIPPFYGQTDSQILQKVEQQTFTCNIRVFRSISSEAKDLIGKMICKPQCRIKPDEILKHPWLKTVDMDDDDILEAQPESIKKALSNLSKNSKSSTEASSRQVNSTNQSIVIQKLKKNSDEQNKGCKKQKKLSDEIHKTTQSKKKSSEEIKAGINKKRSSDEELQIEKKKLKKKIQLTDYKTHKANIGYKQTKNKVKGYDDQKYRDKPQKSSKVITDKKKNLNTNNNKVNSQKKKLDKPLKANIQLELIPINKKNIKTITINGIRLDQQNNSKCNNPENLRKKESQSLSKFLKEKVQNEVQKQNEQINERTENPRIDIDLKRISKKISSKISQSIPHKKTGDLYDTETKPAASNFLIQFKKKNNDY